MCLPRPTLGFSKLESSPGFKFRKSEKMPSSNFFTRAVLTGLPNASKRKASARTNRVRKEHKLAQSTWIVQVYRKRNMALTDVRPCDHVQTIPVCATDVLPVGKQEPVESRMRARNERDGFAIRAVVKIVPRVLLSVWVLRMHMRVKISPVPSAR